MLETRASDYPIESVGSILSANVLVARATDELEDILKQIAEKSWDDIHYAYVVDDQGKLSGIVDLAKSSRTQAKTYVKDLMIQPAATLHPHMDQEKAVLLAVRDDVTALPVVDSDGVFLGAVLAGQIIDVMHDEHLEDALLTSGIRGHGSHIVKLATSRVEVVVASRAPWLVFGAAVGLGLGLVSSMFEKTLTANVALAYFVPVVAFIADSVGTQSEAITVRALATMKLSRLAYLLRELVVGLLLGVLLGVLGGAGAYLISHSVDIGFVVAVSLFCASTIAAVLASLIPITFKALGKDPAVASGPMATALQDLISVLIYLVFATAIM